MKFFVIPKRWNTPFLPLFSGSKSLIFYEPSPVFVVRRIISRATLLLPMESCEGLPCLCPQRCHFLHFLHNQPQPQGFPVINLAQHVICKVSDRSSVRTSHQLSLFKVILCPNSYKMIYSSVILSKISKMQLNACCRGQFTAPHPLPRSYTHGATTW